MIIDLDNHIKTKSSYDALYPLLADKNNIDLYSYEYEIMQAEKLVFSEANGIASAFLIDGEFDFSGFEQVLQEESIIKVISEIAKVHLSVDDLSLQPELKSALLAAFKRGHQSSV